MSHQLPQILIDIEAPEEKLRHKETLAECPGLSPAAQIQAAEDVATEPQGLVSKIPLQESKSWRDLAGIAPNLLNGEDAQEWVNRERNEWSQWEEKILSR